MQRIRLAAAALVLATAVPPALATVITSPPVVPDPSGSVLCLLTNVSTTTIEGIDVQILDFAGDPAGGAVFGTSIDDGGVVAVSTTNDDARCCRWTFPVGRKKVNASILVLDSLGRPLVSMQAE